jgi:hypothetical protein
VGSGGPGTTAAIWVRCTTPAPWTIGRSLVVEDMGGNAADYVPRGWLEVKECGELGLLLRVEARCRILELSLFRQHAAYFASRMGIDSACVG